MFETLLKYHIQKLNGKYTLENGFYLLDEMHEASGTNTPIVLADSILIVKKIIFEGNFTPSAWTAAKKFVELQSKENKVDYSSNFEFYQYDSRVVVKSEFPSVHKVSLKIYYDLLTFLEPVAANIHRAAVEWIKINPLNEMK